MALVSLGPLVGMASGKIGSVVFARNRGGQYVRTNAIPVTSTTDRALAVKSILGSVSQLWATVSAADRQAWLTYARTNPATNRIGKSITLSAPNMFVRCNTVLVGVGESFIDQPPSSPAPTIAPVESFTVTATGEGLDPASAALTVNSSAAAANIRYEVFAAAVSSPTINYVRNLMTRVFVSDAAAGPALDIVSGLESALGTIQSGMVYHVQVRAVDINTGLTSTRLSARVTAVDSEATT